MNGLQPVAEPDGIASVEIHSPLKVRAASPSALPTAEQVFAFMPPASAPATEHLAAVHNEPLPQLGGVSNDELITKLLESLEYLKSNQDSSAESSRDISPSPLTGSGPGSADPDPSSPTDVARFSLRSPVGTISREHSTESLAVAMQQLAMSSHRGPAPFQSGGGGVLQGPSLWGHPIQSGGGSVHRHASNGSTAYTAGPSMSLPMHHGLTGHAPHASALLQQQRQQGLAAGTGVPFMQPGHLPEAAGQDALAMAAAYHAMRLEQLSQQNRMRHLMAPQAPVYEECLVGLQGQYQPYCHQVITEDLNAAALRMLSHLKVMQLSDAPAVGRFLGKRYFCSLKEVSKVVHSARMLVVAPDVRPSPTAHIKPVRLLQAVLASADAAGVPVVYALSRRGIGQVFGRDKSMSIVAVMHIDQVEGEYVALLEGAAQGRELFRLNRGHHLRRY